MKGACSLLSRRTGSGNEITTGALLIDVYNIFTLRTLKRNGVPLADLRSVYCYFIRPLLEYACPVWHSSLTCTFNNQLEDIQRRALRIIYPQMSYKDSITQFDLKTLYVRRELLCESFYKNATRPDSKLFNLLPEPAPSHYNLRKPRRLPLFNDEQKGSRTALYLAQLQNGTN